MKFTWEPADVVGGRRFWTGHYAEPYMIAYHASRDDMSAVSLLDGNTIHLGNDQRAAEKLTEWNAVPFVLPTPPEHSLERLTKTWDATQRPAPA